MGKLTTGHWVTIGVAVLGAAVTLGIHLWQKERPKVRYEEGSWYPLEETQVTSLKIANHGSADAEQVRITVKFDEPLRNIYTDSLHREFVTRAGGIGTKHVTGSIDRLVQGETLYIYFATGKQEEPVPRDKPFVLNVTFNGGKGAPTTHSKTSLELVVAVGFLIFIAGFWAANWVRALNRDEKYREELSKRFAELSEDEKRRLILAGSKPQQ